MPEAPSKPADRLPAAQRPGRFVVVLVAATATGLLLLEGLWRTLGFSPSVTDDEALWATARERVETAGPDTLLILGRSRIHQGFVAERFRERAPAADYIQLAMGGQHPLGTLRDIAENTDFAGTVLVSCTEASFMPELWDQQAGHTAYYHREWGPWKRFIRGLRTAVETRATATLPDVMLQRIGTDLLRREVPKQFLWTAPDRTQTVDYRRVDLEAFAATQLATIRQNVEDYAALPGYRDWVDRMPEVDGWVRTVQARGGTVIFLRMPTSGDYLAAENAYFTREDFWDPMAARTAAVTLHFEDMPVVRDMVCAEGTHLHREDAERFTEILTDKLLRHQWLRADEEHT